MMPSLIYRLKRRRMVSLLLLALGLVVVGVIWGPSLETAGPVWAEHSGKGLAVVMKGAGSEYSITYLAATKGNWVETEALSGGVTAVVGGERLLVFHGREYSTYRIGEGEAAADREGWDSFPHHWNVTCAARAGESLWAFGMLDEWTVAAARLGAEKWEQVPDDLRRKAPLRHLVATGGESGTWLWWREDDEVWGVTVTGAGWGEPRKFDVPADARMDAATVAGVPTLFAVSGLRTHHLTVDAIPVTGQPWKTRLDRPWIDFGGVDSVSVAGGDTAVLLTASAVSVDYANLHPGLTTPLTIIEQTVGRYSPGVGWWFFSLLFASLGIVGIGVTLLFERRRVTEGELMEQVRILAAVAPLSTRFMAAALDAVPFYLLAPILSAAVGSPPVALLLALIFWGVYCTVFEVVWGQTPGKMAFGLAVRRIDGSEADPMRILARNLIRVLEVPTVLIPAVTMISTIRLQRLGDVVAGTHVARLPKPKEPNEEEGQG